MNGTPFARGPRTLPARPVTAMIVTTYGSSSRLAVGFVTVGLLFVYALFFQQVQGDTAVGAGLRFVRLTVSFVITGPLAGRVIERAGHWVPMASP
jgi:DHA2 family methylenomycin A resistance protein-like MFS transporter